MSLIDFLEDLVLENWKFWLEDGRLKYRAPKHAVNNSVLEQLKQYKTEIIKILEDDGLDIFPLSYGQQALWFLWKMSPESSAYNLSLPILFTSPVETNTLLKACKLLTEEHCLLRAVFSVKNGKPFARLTEYIDWTVVDATSWDEKRLLHEMEASHHTLFNLETGPVVRFKLFQRLDKDQILLVAMHHIVSDGWSMEIIRKQLPTLYEKAKKDLLTKPYHHTSYQTYVYWQQELLTSSAGEKLWQFWKEKLAALPVLNLPTDFQRPKVKTYNGKNIFFQLSQELSEKVKGLAKKYSVTPYIFFKTLFLILLHCYTNQDDIVIGSFNSGRSRAEFAAVVGYFVDSIPIRSKLLDRQTFKDFLQQTKETFLEALEHADLPFALIVERLQIERDSSRSPIFDVSFNYLTRTNLSQEKVNEIIETFDIPQSDSKFDLSLTLTDFGKSITGAFSYNSDLFCEETVACICNYFENIVEGVVKDQDQKVSAIALDAEGDRLFRPILVGNNLILESKDLVHRLFEAEAAKRPEDIAVKAENGLLSYRELNRRANGLALYLQQFGVKREALVAVFTKRSTNFIIAILAIHKAAAAYVPLDPSYPKETLSYMLSHAGVAIVLTEESLLHLLDGLNVSTLSIDSFCSDYSHYLCDKNPETEVGLKDLSYVIYTSGSTGKPKGVAIEHGSLSGYVKSIIEEIEIDPKSNFALASTFSADLGNTVIFPSLCSGGCLHILSEEARFHSSNFTNYIESEQIDYLKIVPSHFEALISSTKAVLPKKALIFGGESANRQWVEELQLKHPSCQIVNHYGPTETTVGILTYKVSTKSFPTQTLPLKQPVANTDIYLLDKSMQTVFKGMIGEIYVAGDCLSRGYINSSDTTREAFINYQNTTLYKTGDLARLLPSGEIEIVGRQDRQVKIRGYRVELEHIEAILQGNPSVKQAVVLGDKNGAKADLLIAFVVPNSNVDNENNFKHQLYIKLEEALPSYMVPDKLLLLDEIPLTPNGKVDVRTLREHNNTTVVESGANLPRDLVELELHRIWSEVLKLSDVGISDNFFRLGGHSLLAVQLAERIYEKFNRRISLATLFTSPTIEKLSEVLRSSKVRLDNPILVPIQQPSQKNSLPPFIFLPGAGGNVLYFYHLARSLGLDQPCFGLQALGLNDDRKIPESVKEIACSYVTIILDSIKEPYYLIGHSFGALVAFEIAKQLVEQGRKVAFLGVIDNNAPSAASNFYKDWTDKDWLKHIAIRIGKLYKTDLKMEEIASKNYQEQVEQLIDILIGAKLLPVGLNKEYFSRFVEVYKANVIAAASYHTLPLSGVDITVFRASDEDKDLSVEGKSSKADLGWSEYSSGRVEVVEVAGTHLSMFSQPYVHNLSLLLNKAVFK